jgi:hypothetical protein
MRADQLDMQVHLEITAIRRRVAEARAWVARWEPRPMPLIEVLAPRRRQR